MTEDWKRGRQCDDFVRLQERYQYSKFLILVRGYPAWIRPGGHVTRANYTFLASSSRLSLRRFNIYLNQSRVFQRDASQTSQTLYIAPHMHRQEHFHKIQLLLTFVVLALL